MSGWIKLHKTLKDWEWYDDHNATRLLVHLLVSVNYKDKEWKGQTIKAGTYVTSWENLAKEIGLSVKQTRVAMDKLERSKEVARYATNKWQAITLVKWDKLQCEEVENGKQSGKQRATTKEIKEIKNNTYSFLASLLENGFDEKLSREWVEVRKQLKAVNTETAFNSFMAQVQKHGGDKNRILRTCVERSWKGFNANWLEQENDRLLTALKNN